MRGAAVRAGWGRPPRRGRKRSVRLVRWALPLHHSAWPAARRSGRAAGRRTAPGQRWTVWGQIDQQAFGGERSPAARYDGHLQTAYVGVDARLSERWLAGVAVARSRGDGDWTFGSSTGRLTTTLTSVQPYLRWSAGGTTIWATAGGGSGTAENERVRYGW